MDFQLRTLGAAAAHALPRITTAVIAVILVVSTVGSAANAQSHSLKTSTDIDSVLRNGRSLETDGRWGEALGVYQAALKLSLIHI